MALVTLVYRLDVGLQRTNAVLAKAADVLFNQGLFNLLGMDLVGDDTIWDSGNIKRTITLQTLPVGDSLWPTATDLKNVTRNIFKQAFEFQLPAIVTADEPVVS
jgi:hypothetical protein